MKKRCWEDSITDIATATELNILLKEYLCFKNFMPVIIDFESLFEIGFFSFLAKPCMTDMDKNGEEVIVLIEEKSCGKWEEVRESWEKEFNGKVELYKKLPKEMLNTIAYIRGVRWGILRIKQGSI